MKTRWIVWFLCALALLPIVIAQNATWQPVPVRFSWDRSMSHFCTEASQCLLHVQGSAGLDGDVDKWFTNADPALWPKCVNNTQYLLDYRCDNGNWTTRTKHLAIQLLAYADANAPTNFTLFCDTYKRVLNQYRYLVQGVLVENYLTQLCSVSGKPVPCVNSLCVLKTPNVVAVGATLNIQVNHQQSFLKALERPESICNSVSSSSTTFLKCGNEPVWYNPALNSVIWLPTGTLPTPGTNIAAKITDPLASMSAYVMSVLHNPSNPNLNFAYFPKTRLFNHVYAAQNGNRAVFGFLEQGIFQDGPPPMDYIGVRYSNINLGQNPCLNIIKLADSKAFCENQTGTGFNVIARHRPGQGASPIVQVWPALTGKLRP